MKTLNLICKVADCPQEFEQIHRLNYRTFVEEIPQHQPRQDGLLIDKFHQENTYLIVKEGETLAAMMALRAQRPFSLDTKLEDLDRYLPACKAPVEIRLLTVESQYRGSTVFRLLLDSLMEYSNSYDWDMALISATTRQLHLYRHLGFEPFGPLVGTEEARYQPMFVFKERVHSVLENLRKPRRSRQSDLTYSSKVSLLPGPVPVSPTARAAMGANPVSHRLPLFHDILDHVRHKLCQLSGSRHCQIFPGSGTLANDMVSLQLARLNTPGLVLINGEFGCRIAAQAQRAGMSFQTLEKPWGSSFNLQSILVALDQLPQGGWVWWVLHETSTGTLNPLTEIAQAARQRNLVTAVDAISALGNIPINLDSIHFATAVSGKGLCSYPGLGIVFHQQAHIPPLDNIPAYLDLSCWIQQNGVSFTHSSNLLSALATTLNEQDYAKRFTTIAHRFCWLHSALVKSRFKKLLPHGPDCCPAILTLIPQHGPSAWETGLLLEESGYELSFRSNYLKERNWIQISIMGLPSIETLTEVISLMQ